MSSQALLDAIDRAGKEELAYLESETVSQVKAILAEAQETAESRREAARQEALRPVAAERARRFHEAEMEALKITAAARRDAAEKLKAKIEDRLQELRGRSQYRAVFHRLADQAVQNLGEKKMAGNGRLSADLPVLEVDERDEPLARDVIQDMSIEMEVIPRLTTWGGVIARSADGRIVVANTLEHRLNQLAPHLEKFIP